MQLRTTCTVYNCRLFYNRFALEVCIISVQQFNKSPNNVHILIQLYLQQKPFSIKMYIFLVKTEIIW